VKIQLMSDLHLDVSAVPPPLLADGVELVVVAGDTCEGLVEAIEQLRLAYPLPTSIAMVAGNHEFYSRCYPEELAAGRQRAAELDVCLLENNVKYLGPLRMIGATLWTDYLLAGNNSRMAAMHTARDTMRDHKKIKWSKSPWMRFRPEEALSLHNQSLKFFENELAREHDGPTILLCHHGMVREAMDPAVVHSLLSAAYVSDHSLLLDRIGPDFVVSGHTHYPVDFQLGVTRDAEGRVQEDPLGSSRNSGTHRCRRRHSAARRLSTSQYEQDSTSHVDHDRSHSATLQALACRRRQGRSRPSRTQ
jgi:predicted phosphodiesterase